MVGGRFELLKKLSDGDAAELFLARAASAEEPFILEVVRSEVYEEPELQDRVLEHAERRMAVSHPNIARRIEGGTMPDGRAYFASEPLGESLRSLMVTHGPLGVDELIELAIPLCEALQAFHDGRFVHGNLDPACVYLPGGLSAFAPKLVDCGLALFRSGVPCAAGGRKLVAPEYLCPERVNGQRATIRSDIYGLGVLLYEMVTGFPPFTSSDAETTRRKHLSEAPPQLPADCAKVSLIIGRCLAKDPKLRYPSARAVAEALKALQPPAPVVQPDWDYSHLPVAAVKEGDLLGNFQLLRQLGEGSMARVFQARHVRLGRLAAVKVLKPQHAKNRREVERFFQEARAVNQINHDHIVEIIDFVDEPVGQARCVYCVMEALEGETLGALLKQGPVPLCRVMDIAVQVCAALGAAHRVGVVHRDVKPDNIFITQRAGKDFVKVLDFGVAKLKGVSADGSDSEGASVSEVVPLTTLAGTVIGTPAFMAPEQVLGAAVDARTDVWALGTVLYTCLAGRTPFEARTFPELALQIARIDAAALPEVDVYGDAIPEPLRRAVESCLAKNPADRPSSMEALAELLAPYVETPIALTRVKSSFPVAKRRSSISMRARHTALPTLGQKRARRSKYLKPLLLALAATIGFALVARFYGNFSPRSLAASTQLPIAVPSELKPLPPGGLQQAAPISGKKSPTSSPGSIQSTSGRMREVERDGVLDPFD
jgi:serine/threonine protein kinase